MFRPRRLNSFAALAAGALCACHPTAGNEAAEAVDGPAGPVDIALFSSLPIAQPEGASIAELLTSEAPSHWAVAVLAERGDWRAIDWLGPRDDDRDALAQIDLLILGQPRPLAPEENVALDEYVRRGGNVLLFADPELTQESAYALGDRRRPAAGVMLSPILTRWGLALERDESDRASGVDWDGVSLPLARAGRFRLIEDAGDFAGACKILSDGRMVNCAIGKGRLLAFADAALLEPDTGETAEIRAALLDRMIESSLGSTDGKSRD